MYTFPMDRPQILEFIKKHQIMVISTATANGQPEAAVVGFGETENFEIIFGTPTTSRKYRHIQTNPKVALVIGWDEGMTVQYEGTVTELKAEDKDTIELYLTKVPQARLFAANPDQRFFKITPKWLRFTDTNPMPPGITELTF